MADMELGHWITGSMGHSGAACNNHNNNHNNYYNATTNPMIRFP